MFKQTPKKRVLFVRRFTPALLVFFGVFSLTLAHLQTPRLASAATANTINFQARLQTATGGIVPDGNYNVEFKLYSAASGGSALWTEDYKNSNSAGLKTVNGYLTANLGGITAFPSINWDQQLWLTMNIGGTTTGASPTWDGEMNPRLPLTAVPYAFSAGQLQTTSGSNTSTLSIQAPTGGTQNFVIQDQGAAGTYNLLTTNTANNSFVQLQAGTPGTAQTGNLNITGKVISGSLQAASLDASTMLSIGSSSATGITIGKSGITTTIAGKSSFTGTVGINNTSGVNPLAINSVTTSSGTTNAAQLLIGTGGTGNYGILVQEVAGQASAPIRIESSTGAVLAGFDSSGGVISAVGLKSLDQTTASTNSGNITVTTGNAVGTTSNSGNLILDSGAATGTTGTASLGGTNASSVSIGHSGITTTIVGTTALTGNASVSGTLQSGSSNQFQVDVSGNIITSGTIRSNSGFNYNGTAGTAATCSSGNVLSNIVIQGGIITGAGSCVGAVTTIGTIDGGTYSANGASISGTTMYLQTASGTQVGLVNTGTQTFAGAKTFTGDTLVKDTSATAFQIQNSSSVNLLTVDTTNSAIKLQSTNSAATIGSELMTTTDFTNVAWTTTGWSVTSTVATHTTGNTTPISTSQVGVVAGNTYQIQFRVGGSAPSTETLTPGIGGTNGRPVYGSPAGTITQVIKATTTGPLQFTPSSNWNGTINEAIISVSVKLITQAKSVLQLQDSTGTTTIEIRASAASSNNTYIGLNSGANSTTAASNTALGSGALASTTTGSSSVAIGYNALTSNVTGSTNVAIGYSSLSSNVSGANNLAVGTTSLLGNTTGTGNVGIGSNTLLNNTTGNNNVALGLSAGYADATGGFSTLASLQNSTSIGAFSQVQASNTIVLGSVDNSTQVVIGATVPVGTNAFGVSPVDYKTGTATRTNSSAALVGTGTTWTSAMVGDIIIFADGTTNTVSSFTDATHISMGTTYTGTTDASPVVYRFHTTGFQVSNTGTVSIQATNASAFKVQNNVGTNVLNVNTATGTVQIQNTADNATASAELFTSSYSFPTTSGWTAISGTGSSATATHTGGGGTTSIAPTPALTIASGAYYQVSFSVTGTISATDYVRVRVGSASFAYVYGNPGAMVTEVFNTSSTANLSFQPNTTWSGTISNISVKLLTNYNSSLQLLSSGGSAAVEVRSSASLYNQFIGISSGQFNTTGSSNVAVGASALQYNTTGNNNTATGEASLNNNTSGSSNTATGSLSLTFNTSGSNNTAQGNSSLYANTTGMNNTAQGVTSLTANINGSNNTAQGMGSLGSNVSGSNNTSIGYNSLLQNVSGSSNTALGYQAGDLDSNSKFIAPTTLQNTTSLGAYSVAQQNNTIAIGSADLGSQITIDGTVPVGTNTFGVSPVDLNSTTIQASQTSGSGTITATGAIFSSGNVGELFVWADGTQETITAYTDTTHVIGSSTIITETASYFRTHHIGFQVTNTGNAYVQNTSTTAFQVQSASGSVYLNVDSSTGTITLGSSTSGNYITVSSTGLNAFGTAQHTKNILLTPEFAGAVLDAQKDSSCSSANSGNITTGYDDTNRMNYYDWTSTGTAQCYDVVVQVAIPSDFSSWSGTPDIEMSKDSTGTAAYALRIIPSSGTDANYNSYTTPGTLSTSWSNMATTSLSGTYTAGDYMTVKVRMTSTSSANVKLGNIKLTYNSKY